MKKIYLILILFLSFALVVTAQEVGVTQGQLSVSLTGAANYKIPISVPPGINGVVPQISLLYNSQGGIGLAGYGWNLIGVSAITRLPSTLFHDGVIDPVDFNDLDRFALDDKRLILKSSESSGTGDIKREYETEVFSNLKITHYGGFAQNNPNDISLSPVDYFIVQYPDGSSAKYENHGSATDWTISTWENPQGVSISYEYTQYTGSASPSNNAVIEKIKYGSLKSSGAQINEIAFVYKPRYRAEQAYVGGKSFLRDKLLSSVIIKGNGVGFRSYSLTHDSSSFGIERLKSITEHSGDGSRSYNPTVFEYKNSQGLFNPQIVGTDRSSTFNMSPISNIVINGDFDGDGDIEFFKQNNARNLSLNKILEDNSIVSLAEINFPATNGMFAINSLDANLKISAKQNLCTYTTSFYKIYSYNANSKSIDLEYQKPIPSGHAPSWSGDFDGDGLTDLISRKEPENGYCEISLVDLHRNKTTDYITAAGSIQVGNGVTRLADINGDGKTDLVVFRGDPYNDITVYTLKDNVFTELFRYKENMPSDIGDLKWSRIEVFPIVMGDFNGDGKCDIFLADLKKVLIATGRYTFVAEPLLAYTPRSYDHNYVPEVLVGYDYNNDGKTDILSIKVTPTGYSSHPSNLSIDVFYRTGAGSNRWFNYSFNAQVREPFKTKLIPLFTRKNKIDPSKTDLAIINDYGISFYSGSNYLEDQNLLTSITLGSGVKESITYAELKDNNGVYTAGNAQIYPNLDMMFSSGFKLVSQLEQQSKDQYKKQLYKYGAAVMNLEGLGFLGFASTVKTNWHNDSVPIISYISKNDILQRGVNIENYEVLGLQEPLTIVPDQIDRAIVKQGNYTLTDSSYLKAGQSITLKPDTWIKPESGSVFSARLEQQANDSPDMPTDFITKSRLYYQSELLPNKVFKIQQTATKQFNGLDDTSTESYITYDEHNNPERSLTYVKGSGTTAQTTVLDIEYEVPTASPYIVGRPVRKTQSVAVSSDVMTAEEVYEYQNNLLTQIKKKGKNTDYIAEDNTYDAFGNITKKTITAGGLVPRVISYGYDPSGRFLIKSTDMEELSTTFEYNLNNGLLKSETNPYGLTTSYEYDSWFRRIKETDYLGKTTSYTYNRNGGQTIITRASDNGNSGGEVFDDLGRKIRAGVVNVDGTVSSVDYLYDIQDRNFKTSQPYFGSSGSKWNETKYDDYGRATRHIAYTGKNTDISYSGLTTTVNDGTTSKTYVKNAIGNVISMTETPGGTIKYAYFANGNLKESEYAGLKTTIAQDGWGRKTKLVDSSAGTYTYSYNAFGETTSTKTPNGTTTYTVDDFGKVTQKIMSGTNTNSKTDYFYDPSSKLLTGSSFEDTSNGPGVILNAFTYDDKKRIIQTKETTPYAQFEKEFTYDSFGRVNTETSTATAGGKSSSNTIRNTYKNGSHWQIMDNQVNIVLWQTSTVNENGQITSAGNPFTTKTTVYDSNGFTSQIKYGRTIVGTEIWASNIIFDGKKGNLTSRTNSLFNTNESFEYDGQDRLTEFANAQGMKEKQLYDEKGRITENSLGTYGYSKDKPYQHASLTASPEALTHYTERPLQTISYNSFKSPVSIEQSTDKISFLYNDNNSRTAKFYGGLQDEKLERPIRKYYSGDGSMEVTENTTAGAFDFVTYIGGDGYSAPIVVKSDGTVQEYLYLQRDYQGSIIAVSNMAGTILERRLFDPWGEIVSVQDGQGNALSGLTVLDRGYTGHEHLQSVGLINMNGRIYDPKLHRFLQPDNFVQDPFNTQNYNRYGYVLNNPLKYTDPSGEFWNLLLQGAGFLFSTYVHGGAASGGQANPFKWSASEWKSAFTGAASSAGSSIATGVGNNYLDNYNNKPALGASAIGPGYEMHSFVGDNQFSFKYDPNNVYGDNNNSRINGDLATAGSLVGGISGALNELSLVKFHNAAPSGSFAVNFNGTQRYWSETFKGGTKANISSSFVQAAKNSSGSLKFASKLGGYASQTGSYLAYYGAAENLYNKDFYGFLREGSVAYIGNHLARTRGNIWGIGITLGWNVLGPWTTNSEIYNRIFFGENSAIYQDRERKNGWYESKIFKD